ncbi:MAG: hypothetical protein ACOX8L_02395 [Candidatus Methanomethylophilaceae archaeon]|jgi:sugar phosphate permease
MVNKKMLAERNLNAVTGIMFIIALAIGVAAYIAMDDGYHVILWVVLAITGGAVAALSFLYDNASDGFGPSESSYRFAVGSVMLLAGLTGYLLTYTELGTAIVALIVIIVIAVLAILLVVKNRK